MIVNPGGTKSVNIKRESVSANGTSSNTVSFFVPGLSQENVVVGLFGDGKRTGATDILFCGAMQNRNDVDTCLVAGINVSGVTTWLVSHHGSFIDITGNFSTGPFAINTDLYVEATVQFI